MQIPPHNTIVDAEIVRNPWGDDELSDRSSNSLQFTLGSLFALMTVFAVIVRIANFAVRNYGANADVSSLFLLILGLIALTAIGLTWSIFYYFFPQPTKYASVLGLFVLLPLSMLPCWLIQSREAARRTQRMNQLKSLGVAIQQYEMAVPSHGKRESLSGVSQYSTSP